MSIDPSGALQLGGVAHKNALLISSAAVFAWTPSSKESGEADILLFLDEHGPERGDFLLLGTGAAPGFSSLPFRAEIDRRGMGLEAMDTGAASGTYNVLIAEGRRFTAALLPLAKNQTNF